MSGKRYAEEFKIEAVKQVTDRGYKINDVASRLGVTSKSVQNGRVLEQAVRYCHVVLNVDALIFSYGKFCIDMHMQIT